VSRRMFASRSPLFGSARAVKGYVPSNLRLKLTARGGRLRGKSSVLIAAAAGRSLSAIR